MRRVTLLLLVLGVACKSRSAEQHSATATSTQSAPQAPSIQNLSMPQLIDSLRYLRGNFGERLSMGSFDGNRTIPNAISAQPVSAAALRAAQSAWRDVVRRHMHRFS